MVGWLKRLSSRRSRITPMDNHQYIIDRQVIDFTIQVLKEYGSMGSEGIVYWAGINRGTRFFVTAAVAPKVTASRYGFLTSHKSNSDFVEFICDNGLEYISQVHSHPGKWVDHSEVDDKETAFRSDGLLSIVVPSYCNKGMGTLQTCGIHRYDKGQFYRLTNRYVRNHFQIERTKKTSIITKDMRYE